MGGRVHLVLKGAWELNRPQRTSLMKWIDHGFKGLVAKADKTFVMTIADLNARSDPTKDSKDTLRHELFFETEAIPERKCGIIIGECASGYISITRHRWMGICGIDPKTSNKAFLTTDELLGHALANTALHELGHLFGGFQDNRDAGNFMSSVGPPKDERTAMTMRAFFGGTMKWTPEQESKLVENIRAGKKEGDFTIEYIPMKP